MGAPLMMLVRNPLQTGGTFIEVEASRDVPVGYAPLLAIPGAAHVDYVHRSEHAGYPCLYRRSDGLVLSRDRMTADESSRIYWSNERMTRIFGWVGGAK